MKPTGMIKRIDRTGHIGIPKGVREIMNLKEGSPMELFTEDGWLMLRKYQPVTPVQNALNELKEVIQEDNLLPNRDKIAVKIREIEGLLSGKGEGKE